MNMGYDQTITQRKLKVTKDNEIYLKGTYNPSVGLIEIDHSYLNLYTSGTNKIYDINHWHKR